MFLLNSRHPRLLIVLKSTTPFSLSYGGILPSSFNINDPYAFIYSTYLLGLDLVQLIWLSISRL